MTPSISRLTAPRLAFAAMALACVASISARAQDAVPQTSTLHVSTRLVILDIVVTDAKGRPVDNLSQKDFQIFEDDKLQDIRSFESPSAHLPSSSSPDEAETAAQPLDPAHPAAFGTTPVTVLVFDQLNTHFADSAYARRQLHDYIAAQPAHLVLPTELLTVYENGFQQLAGFTHDRDALLHALDATPTKQAWTLELSGKAANGPAIRLEQSVRALQQIAESAAPIRGRKNLVWIGGGFPTIDPQVIDGPDAKEIKDGLQRMTNLLLDTRVTLYSVDPSTTAAGMTEITDAQQLSFAQLAGNEVAGGGDPYSATDDFDRLGPITGGRVIRGMNNITAQIAQSVDLGSNYYTLAYRPTSNSDTPGKYRKIRVVSLRPGLTVTTRNGYYEATPALEATNEAVSYDLSTAAESSVPLNALHVTVEPDYSVAAPEEAYIIHVGSAQLTWQPNADGTSTAHVAVLAAFLTKQDKLVAHVLHGMTASARSGINLQDSTKVANFNFELVPKAKAAKLRFVVRDAATGRMGTFDMPLTK